MEFWWDSIELRKFWKVLEDLEEFGRIRVGRINDSAESYDLIDSAESFDSSDAADTIESPY